MGTKVGITRLKQQLLAEVAEFLRHDQREWKKGVVETARELREAGIEAVVFGGTLRSLLISRLFLHRPGRPRDIDIVVSGMAVEQLEQRFEKSFRRRTRFGGIQLEQRGWHFDVWPVDETWAFRADGASRRSFAALPSTTAFNLEAVAVQLWPKPGRSRQLFSGNDQFFEGIRNRTLELNRPDNPFPELTVVRALVLAGSIGFKLGPMLARHISVVGSNLSARSLDEIQGEHYGMRRLSGETLRQVIDNVAFRQAANESTPVDLPALGQLELWRDEPREVRLNVHVVGG